MGHSQSTGPRALARGAALLFATVAVLATPAGATTAPAVKVSTIVSTTLPVYEFTTWFGVSAVEISCEIDYRAHPGAASPANEAYCMSTSARLTHHVTVTSSGIVKSCTGAACGSNAGLGTPSFYPGTEVRSGPFVCDISAHAVTCRARGRHGFVLTASTISRL